MKLYLAGSSADARGIAVMASLLRLREFEVVSTWHEQPELFKKMRADELWDRCFTELESAHALLIFPSATARPLRGALVEFGFALALGMECFVIGEHEGDWVAAATTHPYASIGEWLDVMGGN